jgi:hypothetical protein
MGGVKQIGKREEVSVNLKKKIFFENFSIDEWKKVLYENIDPAYKGDLNRDGIEDGIEMYEDDNGDRELVLFLGTKKGSFKKVATNSSVVLRADEGGARGDPFMDVVIKNGYFSVEHYGGAAHRWKTITTFKYSKAKKNWFLHKDSFGNYEDKEDLDEIKWKIRTVKDFGVVLFEDYDKDKE